ncbi:MAG: SOS response-associated peptidase [Alphaproteobacteria bacterium]|nr:MAG: SOS response-associated peptidase [Alphaproteobacteria bacterium]
MNKEEYPTWRELYEYYNLFTAEADRLDAAWQTGDLKPTDPVPIVAHRSHCRRLTMARWWLVPRYARELDSQFSMFNARSDKLIDIYYRWKASTPRLRQMIRSAYLAPLLDGRRCLIPMNGYYEFKGGQPYFFTINGARLFSVAGLWEWNKHIRTPEWPDGILSCTMITTEPNSAAAPIHDRMPAILRPYEYEDWLSTNTAPEHALSLLKPYPGNDLTVRPVELGMNDQPSLF